jgi:hypothetical protein
MADTEPRVAREFGQLHKHVGRALVGSPNLVSRLWRVGDPLQKKSIE